MGLTILDHDAKVIRPPYTQNGVGDSVLHKYCNPNIARLICSAILRFQFPETICYWQPYIVGSDVIRPCQGSGASSPVTHGADSGSIPEHCRICVVSRRNGTGVSPRASVFPWHYHHTQAPHRVDATYSLNRRLKVANNRIQLAAQRSKVLICIWEMPGSNLG